jgi:hypothetical protein
LETDLVLGGTVLKNPPMTLRFGLDLKCPIPNPDFLPLFPPAHAGTRQGRGGVHARRGHRDPAVFDRDRQFGARKDDRLGTGGFQLMDGPFDLGAGCGEIVAFDVTDVDEYRRRLIDFGAHFDEQNVPDAGFQMFVRDPVGNKLELNFPNSEAPQRVAPGTLSAIQFPHLAKSK